MTVTIRESLIEYLSDRRDLLELKLEELGDIEQWVDEYVRVDDFILWLRSPEATQIGQVEEREGGYLRRYGLAARLRPEIDRLMDDGLPRTAYDILTALDEPAKSSACINAILNDWEYKLLYKKVGRRGRSDIWRKLEPKYPPGYAPPFTPTCPTKLVGDDGSTYQLARN